MRSDLKRVLIVDDNEFVRRAIGAVVEGLGNARVCGEAANGTEAISRAVDLQPDAIIMDFSMPGMNGLQASMVIKRNTPVPRIIMFTIHPDKVTESLAKTFGVDLVVSKEQGTAGLLGAIRTLFPNCPAVSPC